MSTRMLALGLAGALAATGTGAAQEPPAAASLRGLIREIACAPASPSAAPASTLRVAAGQDRAKTLLGTGDRLIVGSGSTQGVRVGNEYFARRVVNDSFAQVRGGTPHISIHTGGTIQILEVLPDSALAVVSYGCDGVLVGDYLDPFETPALPPGVTDGAPDFESPGRVILGDDRRQIAAAGEFVVIDRGSDHGLKAGHRVTLFRRTLPDGTGPVATIGTAVVYAVRPETSAVRIDRSVEAVYVGDLVAIHR